MEISLALLGGGGGERGKEVGREERGKEGGREERGEEEGRREGRRKGGERGGEREEGGERRGGREEGDKEKGRGGGREEGDRKEVWRWMSPRIVDTCSQLVWWEVVQNIVYDWLVAHVPLLGTLGRRERGREERV